MFVLADTGVSGTVRAGMLDGSRRCVGGAELGDEFEAVEGGVVRGTISEGMMSLGRGKKRIMP